MRKIRSTSKYMLVLVAVLVFIGLLALAAKSPWAATTGMLFPLAGITFSEIQSGIKKTGVYAEIEARLASRSLPSAARKSVIIAQRLKAMIEPARFQGGTLDDATSGGDFAGTAVREYRVKISTAAATDKYQYSVDGGVTWSVESDVSGGAEALGDGVTITFAATTGHAVGDEWHFTARPEPTVTQLVATQVFSDTEAAGYFGQGSMAHLMARAAMKRNRYIDLTIVALDDAAAGTAPSGTVTITGTATASGTLRVYIGDEYVNVAVSKDDTAAQIAIALANAIAAKSALPVVADNLAGVVTVTAKHKGISVDDIHLGYDLTGAAGVSAAIVDMTGGATDPTLQDALDVIFGTRFHIQCVPYNNAADLATFAAHLANVSNGMEKRGAIGIYATTGALATATTLSGQVNAERVEGGPFVRYTSASKRRTPSWIVAAIATSAEASRSDPGDPIMNLDMTGVAVPDAADRLGWSECQTCLENGVSPIEIGPGDRPRIVRAPSTWQLDENNVDVFLDMHKITSMDYGRDSLVTAVSSKSPKKIIREATRKSVKTVDIIKSITLDVAYRLQDAEIFTGVSDYRDLFIVEEDAQNVGQINIQMPSPVVDGLYVVAAKLVLY